jgi:hypothetical protein
MRNIATRLAPTWNAIVTRRSKPTILNPGIIAPYAAFAHQFKTAAIFFNPTDVTDRSSRP